MSNLTLILGALGPVFAMIVLGFGLRQLRFPGDGFWPEAERFTYFILFPALLVRQLALARLTDYAVGPVALIIVLLLATMTFLRTVPWAKLMIPPPSPDALLSEKVTLISVA